MLLEEKKQHRPLYVNQCEIKETGKKGRENKCIEINKYIYKEIGGNGRKLIL